MGAVRKTSPAAEQRDERVALLGVETSARGLRWVERLAAHEKPLAEAMRQRHDLSDLMSRLLAARGVGIEGVDTYLNPSIKALMPDPSRLRDMDKAAARLADSVTRGEAIAIFGDYDVDGACSSALLYRFFAHHGIAARIYIPDRIFEGYGPNTAAMQTLVKDGAKLIITADCGTTSFEPLAEAARLKTDVVVIDHHQANENLPPAHAIVNPNRQDDVSGQGQLCAAGVVFLALVATARELRKRGYYRDRDELDMISLLDLVALATVADVVPLAGLNRAYVTKGLAVMHARRNTGLRALADAAGLAQAPTPYHLGFVLGPRINAGGRIGDAALGAKLLSTSDEMEAQGIAEVLDRLNRERKQIETGMLEEAIALADRQIEQKPDAPMIIAASETWHKGIVGLVASRLVERFGRPACVIAWEKSGGGDSAEGSGSLRSVAGIDLGAAVRRAESAGLLVKGGGHAMAAGLTVKRDRYPALQEYFFSELSSVNRLATAPELEIDAALTASGATADVLTELARAGPYGQGNPQPRFAFPAHRVKFAKIVGESHVRLLLEASDGGRLEAVAFRAKGQPLGDVLMNTGGLPLHVCGTLKRDTWGGREKIELHIEDAAIPHRRG